MNNKGQLATQQSENQIVLEELESLEGDAQVYKSTGPLLVKQTTEEAREIVRKRLDFLQNEM